MSYPEYNINRTERRSGLDRRKNLPTLFSKYWVTGMRSVPRRQEDRLSPKIVDRYSKKILAIILFILGLSILDAAFTLVLVERGAKELNPFMAYYLERSPFIFFCIKYMLTSASVLLILFIKDFYIFKTKFKAKILLFLFPIPFVFVIHWQLGLLIFHF